MSAAIMFGGPGGLASADTVTVVPGLEGMLQEFFHYFGKIWLNERYPGQDRRSLEAFDLGAVVSDYRAHRNRGGAVDVSDGLELEPSFIMTQLLARRPLTCLLDGDRLGLAASSIERAIATTSPDLVERTRQLLDPRPGQPLLALVHNGIDGHCIVLRGVDQRSILFWDPWPLHSLLCAVNHGNPDVDAKLVDEREFLWALDDNAMGDVLCAVFAPTEA